jgi:mRNA-degrading endonuclease toxin of MazEF toxin-antitoxin module
MPPAYVPDAGDIVWINFDPRAGHEQAGHRPAVVLSPAAYNAKTSLMLCCPMTTQIKSYSLRGANCRSVAKRRPGGPNQEPRLAQ